MFGEGVDSRGEMVGEALEYSTDVRYGAAAVGESSFSPDPRVLSGNFSAYPAKNVATTTNVAAETNVSGIQAQSRLPRFRLRLCLVV